MYKTIIPVIWGDLKIFLAYYPVLMGSIMCLCKTDLPTPRRSSQVCTPHTRISVANPVTLAGLEPVIALKGKSYTRFLLLSISWCIPFFYEFNFNSTSLMGYDRHLQVSLHSKLTLLREAQRRQREEEQFLEKCAREEALLVQQQKDLQFPVKSPMII